MTSSGLLHSLKFGLIVMFTVFISCQGAPARSTKDTPWWFDPCNSDIRLRHGRSAKEHPTTQQINIFTKEIKLSCGLIDQFYKTVLNNPMLQNKKSQIKSLQIKKMIRKLQSSARKNQNLQLKEFYKDLQFFAGHFEVLRNTSIKTNHDHFNEDQRKKIYTKISFHLRNLMCTVVENLEGRSIKPKNIRLEKMNITIPKRFDATAAFNLDRSLFYKAKSFFKASKRILARKKTKQKKNKTSAVPKRRT